MPLAPSRHDLRGWLKSADEEREPSHVSADRTAPSAPNKADHPFRRANHPFRSGVRSGVPRLDRFLMTSLLLVVAGWIVFRLVTLLVTLH